MLLYELLSRSQNASCTEGKHLECCACSMGGEERIYFSAKQKKGCDELCASESPVCFGGISPIL